MKCWMDRSGYRLPTPGDTAGEERGSLVSVVTTPADRSRDATPVVSVRSGDRFAAYSNRGLGVNRLAQAQLQRLTRTEPPNRSSVFCKTSDDGVRAAAARYIVQQAEPAESRRAFAPTTSTSSSTTPRSATGFSLAPPSDTAIGPNRSAYGCTSVASQRRRPAPTSDYPRVVRPDRGRRWADRGRRRGRGGGASPLGGRVPPVPGQPRPCHK